MSDDVRLGLIVGGALLVLGALLWRYLSRRRAVRVLVRRFRADDPQERARGGILLVDLGLSRAARPLLTHVATEADPRVRLAIALAVGRRQWEPSSLTRVKQLRGWAGLELEQQGQPVSPLGPAVTRLSDMGGPRPPEPESTPTDTPLAVVPDPAGADDGSPGAIRWEVDSEAGTT